MTAVLEEATVGLEPTYEGFAGPDLSESDPCTPLGGFRVRVCYSKTACPTQTLNRLLGPGNRHNSIAGFVGRLHQQVIQVKTGTRVQTPRPSTPRRVPKRGIRRSTESENTTSKRPDTCLVQQERIGPPELMPGS